MVIYSLLLLNINMNATFTFIFIKFLQIGKIIYIIAKLKN